MKPKVKLMHGDCIAEMKKIPDGFVDLVVCDPPYGVTGLEWDSVIPFDLMWGELERICKPNATIVLFGAGMFSMKLAVSKERWYKYSLIWVKNRTGAPTVAKFRPMPTHEDVLVFTVGGGKHGVYNPQMTEGKAYKVNGEGRERKDEHWRGYIKAQTKEYGAERFPRSILEFGQEGDRVHPTQKPVELLKWLIRSYSNENDVVLDFTMGSGSTGVAAAKTKRRFIGIELNDDYFAICQKRVADAIADGTPTTKKLL